VCPRDTANAGLAIYFLASHIIDLLYHLQIHHWRLLKVQVTVLHCHLTTDSVCLVGFHLKFSCVSLEDYLSSHWLVSRTVPLKQICDISVCRKHTSIGAPTIFVGYSTQSTWDLLDQAMILQTTNCFDCTFLASFSGWQSNPYCTSLVAFSWWSLLLDEKL